MSIFLTLFINLLPLYALIAAGYFAARVLNVDKNSLGNLAIYIFMPVVVFGFVVNLDFQPAYISLPIFYLIASVVLGLGFFAMGQRVFRDKQANLMSMCVSMGNTGYFGLPLVLLFFDKEMVAIYVFMMLGGAVYEATVGYYIAARSHFDVRQSVNKLLKFPVLYAMAAGLSINALGVEMPDLFWDYWAHFKGAYVIIGMMIIGAALASIDKFVFGPRFVAFVFVGKFIMFPLCALIFIMLDRHMLHWLSTDIHNLVVMMTIVPPAANVAAYATQMNMEPEKAATTILIGTVFALFYIPCIIMMMGL